MFVYIASWLTLFCPTLRSLCGCGGCGATAYQEFPTVKWQFCGEISILTTILVGLDYLMILAENKPVLVSVIKATTEVLDENIQMFNEATIETPKIVDKLA